MRKLLFGLIGLVSISSVALAQKTASLKVGDLTLRTDARITFDGALYAPSSSLDGWKWDGQDFRLSNGSNITQARFGIWGSLGEKWTGKFDIKVVDNKISLQDVFLDYKINPKNLYIRAGYYVDPVSVEVNAASSYLSFNTPHALSFLSHQTRFMGLSLTSYGKHHYVVGGVYGSSLGGSRSLANRGSDGWGVTLRGAYLPINEDYNTLYFGAYARYRTPDVSLTGTRDGMNYSTHIGSTIDGRSFQAGALTRVSGYSILGAEFAMTKGRWHFMGEYLVNNVYFKDNNPYNREAAFFHGGYLTASYMIFGKQRKYLNYWGIFSPLSNVPDTGNLELMARLSYANGNDKGESGQSNIYMGKSTVGTIGLNWYPHGGNLLLGVNYSYTHLDQYARAMGKLTAPGLNDSNLGIHTLQCRVQFVF